MAASDDRPGGIGHFLFGCTPATLIALLGILAGLMLGPPLLSAAFRWINPPEPRVVSLPSSADGNPWLRVSGAWHYARDLDEDGTPDCFLRAASGRDSFVAAGHRRGCLSGVQGMLSRVLGFHPLDGELRDSLTRLAAFKRDRGWMPLSVIDVDGNDTPDCVVDRFGGLIAQRLGTSCPGEDFAIPARLTSHERHAELEQVFRLESRVREALAAARER